MRGVIFLIGFLTILGGCATPEHLTVDGGAASDEDRDGDDNGDADDDETVEHDADETVEPDADETVEHDADETVEPDAEETTDAGTCVDDDHEDNDIRADSTTITAGDHTDLKLCAGDDDFYVIELTEGDDITVSLDFVHAEGNIDMELLGPLGFVLTSSNSFTDGEEVSHTAASTGEHFIRVFLVSDVGSPGNDYTMSVDGGGEVVIDCEVDDSEPNDTIDEATDLGDFSDADLTLYSFQGGDIPTEADVDWFTAHIEDTWMGSIHVVALLEGLTGDLDLCVSFECDDGDYATVTCLSETSTPYGEDTCCSGEYDTADENVTMSVMCGSSTLGDETGRLYYTIAGYEGAISCDYQFSYSFGS